MVRVIGPDSAQLGVMAVSEALRTAREMELDLVEVAPTSRPPVCRIMDFGKYRYEQAKRDQKAKRKQHLAVVKEVKLRPKIEEHDFDFKMKHARKFLEERDKVKVSVLFRGRELSHMELGYALIESVVQALADIASVEQKPALEGRMLVMMLSPKPGASPAKPKRDEGARSSEPGPLPAQ
jgi:translation initiation factor IF-3